MNWMHNPIGDMTGPDFLLVYGCTILVTLFFCWLTLEFCDDTESLPELPVPDHPDPVEIAYLRGGPQEVARVLLLDLLVRGFLQVNEEWSGKSRTQKLGQSQNHCDLGQLSPTAREVLDWFATPATVHDFFQDLSIQGRIQRDCERWKERCEGLLLLGLEARRAAGVFWAFLGTAIIGGLGSYKLLVALLKGKSNVIFLIIMGVVAVVLLLKLCNPPRLTHRGRRYLTQLQSSFRSLKEDFEDGCAPQTGVLFLVGLFGMDALAHTAYAGHRDLFAKASAGGGSGGCGGGCGSCSGGLRCLSLAINGDPFTADPGCWHSVGRRAARGSCEERTGPTEGLQRNVRHSGFEEKIATGR